MKAIILAAGEGTRLRPLTDDKPKCLVNLFGKSILERQIDVMKKCGIDEIIIITGYKSEKLQKFPVKIYHNKKYGSTNMLESLFLASGEFESPLIVSYGDIIYEKKILKSLIDSPDNISIVVDKKWKRYWEKRFKDPLSDAESLVLKNNQVMEVGKSVDSFDKICGQYIGLMKFQGSGIDIIKNHYFKKKSEAKNGINPLNNLLPFEKSYLTDFLNSMIVENVEINAIPINNGWLELDTISDYKLYRKLFKENTLSTLIELDDCS